MLTFHEKYIAFTFLTQIDQSLDCHRYEVKKDDQIIATLFCAASLSLIILPSITLRIERERRPFKKSHHSMFDHSTGTLVGVFEFPDWQSPSNTRCILRLMEGAVYSFSQNNEHRRLLKPKTWSVFRYDMSNSENFISYVTDPSSGEIECTDESNLLPIVSGIFIIDEKFRLLRETD